MQLMHFCHEMTVNNNKVDATCCKITNMYNTISYMYLHVQYHDPPILSKNVQASDSDWKVAGLNHWGGRVVILLLGP